MKSSLLLVLVIVALAGVEATWSNEDWGSNGLQQAVGADMDLKMLMVEDGTPKGKCYCSCSLNDQPVFLEIDPSMLPASYEISV